MPGNTKIKPENRKKLEERIAERVIEAMEAGGLPPWERGWASGPESAPRNGATGRPYRGVNVLLTEMTRQAKGYGDPRWLTFRQALTIGRQVRRGETSTMIVLWKFPERDHTERAAQQKLDRGEVVAAEDAGDGPPAARRAPLARGYHIFNVEQTDGDNPLDPLERREEVTLTEAAAAADATIAGWSGKPEIRTELGGLPPRYYQKYDRVLVPASGRYTGEREYYTSVFHELVHSTGHSKRLARPMENLHAYGREEMVAGMGAAMLTGLAGFSDAGALERDAAYVDHWRRVIEADHSSVIYAAQKAQQACDMILGVSAPSPAGA